MNRTVRALGVFAVVGLLAGGAPLLADDTNPSQDDKDKDAKKEALAPATIDGNTVTKEVTATGPSGKTATGQTTWTKDGNTITRQGTFTGPNGKTATKNVTTTKSGNTVTRDATTTLPNGKTPPRKRPARPHARPHH